MNGLPTLATRERIRVRYGEADPMGHAYYGSYLYWLEQARGAFCRDRGFSYLSLEEQGYFLPVVEVHLRYRNEVRYDDEIEVRVWIDEIRRAALRFRYEISNLESGARATEGYTWHVLMGTERKAVTIPESIRALLLRDPAETERTE